MVLTLIFLSLFPKTDVRQTGTTDAEQYAGGYFVEFTDDDLVG
jgi:hypothetical protein